MVNKRILFILNSDGKYNLTIYFRSEQFRQRKILVGGDIAYEIYRPYIWYCFNRRGFREHRPELAALQHLSNRNLD